MTVQRGLDPTPSDAELRRKYEQQTGHPVPSLNGIRLGPGSPVLANPAARERAEPTKRTGPTEHDLQAELFQRIQNDLEVIRRPALAMCFAVPNAGQRTKRAALKLKAEGLKSGVPDICCPVARGGWFGLWIEMKLPNRPIAPSQADWLAALEREGYKVAVHESVEGAWAELVNYLDMPRTIPSLFPGIAP